MTSDADRKRKSRANQKKAGWIRFEAVVHQDDKPILVDFVNKLRRNRNEKHQ